jgi:hypothetical protein
MMWVKYLGDNCAGEKCTTTSAKIGGFIFSGNKLTIV